MYVSPLPLEVVDEIGFGIVTTWLPVTTLQRQKVLRVL